MGRRKIEIKPIRDDRNRSVTFLKRKGGLFKKAHELSVLCSVDVAVVIFGHNKKLYEYSSSDIGEIIGRFNYYGGAHEHKGPADFADKGGGDDDDDDEGGDDVDEQRGTPVPDAMMHPHMQHHPGFQHVRHETPSGSPPMHNGAMPHFQRGPSPLPPGVSRPSSRASQHPGHNRRTSSNLAHQTPPQHHPSTVPQPGNYAYMPNAPFYNQPGAGPASQRPPQQGQPSQSTYPPPYPPQGAQHPQMQALMMQDNRRSSMPPAIPAQPTSHDPRHPSQDHLHPPPHSQSHPSPRMSQQTPPQPQQRPNIPTPQPSQFQSPPMPQPKPLPNYAKSNIFTPIDDSRSMLAQHWGSSSNADSRQEDGAPRPQSVDASAMNRERAGLGLSTNGPPPPKPASPRRPLTRSPKSMHPAAPSPKIPPPPLSRSSTMQSSDAKRPRLKVQIPSEASGDEGGTGGGDEVSTSQPSNASGGQHHGPSHGVVLPPPSPSTSALLSAGAQGPPNPFARPAPPMSTNPHASNRDPATSNPQHTGSSHNAAAAAETPISALPSRFVSDNLLPSPSTFYPEWGFGRAADNMLPSPLNFQTPVVANGQGWRGGGGSGGEEDRKRPAEGELEGGEAGKKAKG